MRPLISIRLISPGDARGWIGFGCYLLVIIILAMIGLSDKNLLENDFFKVLATAIVLTGWNNGPVGWAYQATKGGGEAAESSARIAENAAGVPGNGDKANGKSVPQSAAEAADQTAAAAAEEAAAIGERAVPPAKEKS